ncbi:NBS-LRR type resistance protein [Cucumis melo var. makuwa]|uniref:NBS-LRR type resistance protein n=1 Tax=Cucumis melo var. makuwa TaxID=1194695 RepID=A0A5D3DBM3_CUCMM|nr:NBS-LRR type resistance protein [Cucumis melo var. makuwa]
MFPYGVHESFLPLAGLLLALPLLEKVKHKRSSDLEGYTHQSSDPMGCTYQSSDPVGYIYQSSDPKRYTTCGDPVGHRVCKQERGSAALTESTTTCKSSDFERDSRTRMCGSNGKAKHGSNARLKGRSTPAQRRASHATNSGLDLNNATL